MLRVVLELTLCAFAFESACEPRIDQPTPVPKAEVSVPPATPSPGVAPTTSPTPASTPAGEERCVAPTPEVPPPAPPAGPDPGCPNDPDGRFKLRFGRVVFDEASTSVEVELAEKDEHRLRGLMYRKAMGEEQGMLFVFEEREVHSFWMKNTCIPLDMLFIDHDGLIVGIAENVPTMNEKSSRVPCPSMYVLEVNAGWSRRHDVKAGQHVKLEL